MAKSVESFIADRTSRGEKSGGKSSNGDSSGGVMLPVATIAVGLSIAVMIITLAVIFGFKREVHNKLTELSGQIVVASTRGVNPATEWSIKRSDEVVKIIHTAAEKCGVEVVKIAPYSSRGAIIRGADAVDGVVLKGIDSEYDTSRIESGIIDGEMIEFGDETASRTTLISKALAAEMKLKVGSRLELLITDSEGKMRRDLYRVGGVYTTGFGDTEKPLIITDIRNVTRLNNWESDRLSGYEVWLSSLDAAPEVAEAINYGVIFSESDDTKGVAAFAAQSLYPSIFDWLAAHDINATVILSIMLIVALFNIITAMLILVLERTHLIGTLKVLGMRDMAIRKIFLIRALGITLRGVLWGNIVSVALCLIQHYFKPLTLDESGYMLAAVPIDLGFEWLLMLNIGVVVAILLLVIIPTKIVSRIEPSQAIKFN